MAHGLFAQVLDRRCHRPVIHDFLGLFPENPLHEPASSDRIVGLHVVKAFCGGAEPWARMNHEQKGDGRQQAVGEAEGVGHAEDEAHGDEPADRRIGEPAYGRRNTSDEGDEDDDEGSVEEVGHRIHVLQKGLEWQVAS